MGVKLGLPHEGKNRVLRRNFRPKMKWQEAGNTA
jgi:hypothetical protein